MHCHRVWVRTKVLILSSVDLDMPNQVVVVVVVVVDVAALDGDYSILSIVFPSQRSRRRRRIGN
jgi:hypothetical protein